MQRKGFCIWQESILVRIFGQLEQWDTSFIVHPVHKHRWWTSDPQIQLNYLKRNLLEHHNNPRIRDNYCIRFAKKIASLWLASKNDFLFGGNAKENYGWHKTKLIMDLYFIMWAIVMQTNLSLILKIFKNRSKDLQSGLFSTVKFWVNPSHCHHIRRNTFIKEDPVSSDTLLRDK